MTGFTKTAPSAATGLAARCWISWCLSVLLLLIGGPVLSQDAPARPPASAPAQTAAPAAPSPATVSALPPVPDTVNTTISARHVRVPGSTFYVRKPADYAAEESLNGLAKPNGALLEVMRVPQANFLKVRGLIVQQYLADKGRVVEQRELMFNGYPAVYGEGESIEPGKDLMVLAYGDSSSIMLVFGLYQENDAQSKAELRQMLLSGWYDARGKIPPLELAPFVIDLRGSPFKFQQVRDNGKLYVFGLTEQPAAAVDSFATRFTVQILPTTPFLEVRQRLMRLALERTAPGAQLKTEERQLTVPQAFAHELSASSTWRNRRLASYQLIRTDDDATLLFDGLAFPAAPPKAPAVTKPVKGAKTTKPAPAKPVEPDPVAVFRKVAATLRMKH